MRPKWLRSPRELWWSSLPLRVVGSTVALSAIVLWLGGLLLVNQATNGMKEAKRASALAQVNATFNEMQQQLREADPSAASLNQQLNELVDAAGEGGDMFIVIDGPLSGIKSSAIQADSVPDSVRTAVAEGGDFWLTSTTVNYTNASTDPVPGLVIGTRLLRPITGEAYPTYFIFPLTTEVATLQALQQAALTTGLLLLAALGGISYLVVRQVVRPVRRASQVAGRLAAGELTERLEVTGTDDLASLATSMNNMAFELQQHIGSLEHLSRVQRRFVSDVSHELRTPLTTVKMASEMLYDNREEFSPANSRVSELLHDEIDRFEALLSELLEISRFDAGAATLVTEEVDLSELVRQEVGALKSVAALAKTELQLVSESSAVADVDPRRVRRIVMNLLTNAIEHGERKPIIVTVAASETAVAITVRDHGVGFEATQSSMVFERFWRADPSRLRTLGGTGLGLSIALEDARLHGGWLSAWGRPGAGAQFRLTLPRQLGTALTSSPLPLIPAGDHKESQGGKQ